MKHLLLWLGGVACLSGTGYLSAQPKPDSTKKVVVERLPAETFMKTQVAHLSEFVRRFNNQINAEGKPQPDSLKTAILQRQQIEALFDGLSVHPSLANYRMAFTESATDTTSIPLLTYPPKDLWAVFELWVSLDGKTPQAMRCTLQLARRGKGYLWQWQEAEAPFLQKIPAKLPAFNNGLDSSAYIAPNAHETAFLDLFNLINQRKDLRYTCANPTKLPAALAYVNSLVAQKRLRATHTEAPVLYVGMGKSWIAGLVFQNRTTSNSGWLIQELYLLPTDTKHIPFKTSIHP